jgi:hypothetical protein
MMQEAARPAAETVPEILGRIRQAIVEEVEPELVARGTALAHQEAEDRVRTEVAKREQLEAELEAERRGRLLVRDGNLRRARIAGARAGRVVRWATIALGLALLFGISVMGSGLLPADALPAPAIVIGGVLLVIVGLVNLVTGGSLRSLAREIEVRTSTFVESRYAAFLGVDSEPPT